jgi:hypothetical protein
MLNGVMLLWFLLTAAAVVAVAIDIRHTPESPVLKWGFVLLTAYIGPLGAFLYVLGCREPLPGLHEQYVSARWRQVLGSTMHCVAGDGIGILVGATVASFLALPRLADMGLNTSSDSVSAGRSSRRYSCARWLAAHTEGRSPALSFRSSFP